MANENEIIPNIDEKSIQIQLSKQFFTLESARAASYKFTDRFFISIEPDTEDLYRVKLQPKNLITPSDISILVSEFKNEMLDQQIRIDLANRFGSLRETIVECAFKPINSIGDKKRP